VYQPSEKGQKHRAGDFRKLMELHRVNHSSKSGRKWVVGRQPRLANWKIDFAQRTRCCESPLGKRAVVGAFWLGTHPVAAAVAPPPPPSPLIPLGGRRWRTAGHLSSRVFPAIRTAGATESGNRESRNRNRRTWPRKGARSQWTQTQFIYNRLAARCTCLGALLLLRYYC